MFTEELFVAQVQLTNRCCYMKMFLLIAVWKSLNPTHLRTEAILDLMKHFLDKPRNNWQCGWNFFFLSPQFLKTWHLRAVMSPQDLQLFYNNHFSDICSTQTHNCFTHKLPGYFRGSHKSSSRPGWDESNYEGSYDSWIVPESVSEVSKLKELTDDPSQNKLSAPKHVSQLWDQVTGKRGQREDTDGQECLPWLVSDALFVVVPRCCALIVEEGHFALVGGGEGAAWGRDRGRGFVVRMKSRVFSFCFLLSLKAPSSSSRLPPLSSTLLLFQMSFRYRARTCSHTVWDIPQTHTQGKHTLLHIQTSILL